MSIEEIIEKNGRKKENLIHILTEIQDERDDHYIPEDIAKLVARELNMSESKIASTLSFYTAISNKPRGKYIIQICSNVSCYINGSINVINSFEKELGIKMGETTEDGLFTLEQSSCLGACDKSPAVRINKTIYGFLNDKKIKEIITNYRTKGANENDSKK